MQEANLRGMHIPAPADCQVLRADPKVLEQKLEQCALNKCEFVLVAHPDTADDMHCEFIFKKFVKNLHLAALKYCERIFMVITQGLRLGTIRNVVSKGQPLTVQNIVNKTNVKVTF